jgi:DNA adenine methylase
MLRSPLAWVGGKSRLRAVVIRKIPPHECYVELFAGAAWVLLGKDPKSSMSEVFNDLDGDLVNFWRVLKHRPAEFAEAVGWVLDSRELWQGWKVRRSVGPEIDRAIRFYGVLRFSFAALGEHWGYAFKGRPRGHETLSVMRAFAARLADRLRGVYIEHGSWSDCLQRYDRAQTFFYVDPPYRGLTQPYVQPFEDRDHRALAQVLLKAKSKWLLSYNDDPVIRELYSDRRGVTLEVASVGYSIARTGRARAAELLIRNYPLA